MFHRRPASLANLYYVSDRHSSSSAIFERDIEPLGIPSLGVPLAASTSSPSYPSKPSTHAISASTSSNPHRIPRSKTTEALELTVPSVLDSAVNALSVAEESGTSITVLSPVPSQSSNPLVGSHSGSAIQSPVTMHPQSSPVGATFPPSALNNQGGIGSLGSMSGTSGGSPSPPTMSLLLQGMGMSGLMSASASVSGAPSASGRASGFASPLGSSRSPSPARSASPPAHQGADVTIPGGSPPSQTKEVLTFTSSPLKRPSLPSAAPGLGSNPNAPSPNMRASNRLSFVSYNDVLTSAPIAAQPLATVLAPGQNEPPTHLVVVDPDNGSSALGMTPTTSTGNLPLGGIGSLNVNSAADKVDVDSLGTVGLSSTGEWGREGLGGGLEERLERLWAVEREVAERGRVMTPTRVGPTSRSGSMSASTDASNAPLPPLVINPPVPASPAPAAASST